MNFKKMISVLLLFCFSFGAGSLAASVKEQRSGPAAPAAASADGNWGLILWWETTWRPARTW